MSDFTFHRDKHIKSIIDNFDFNKVNKIMEYLDWRWYTSQSLQFEVPSVPELRDTAKILLENIYDSDDDIRYISSGGFRANKYDDFLELEFVITDYSSEVINYSDKNYEKQKKVKIRKNKILNINKNENN